MARVAVQRGMGKVKDGTTTTSNYDLWKAYSEITVVGYHLIQRAEFILEKTHSLDS